jgi:hypothetical protein
MTSTYKKRYPKGTSIHLPTWLQGRYRLLEARGLLYLMCRAYGRYDRWKRQAVRRRPTLLRPLTPGERTLLHLKAMADELASLLAPFRLTRPRGHEPLRELLADAETRPTLVAQVRALEASKDAALLSYPEHERQVEGWRREWDYATPERRQCISEVEKGHAISAMLRAFNLLTDEAKNDIAYITSMNPQAFKPTPEVAARSGVSQPNQATGPTPYSG